MQKKADWADSIKQKLKRYPAFYRLLVLTIAPTFASRNATYKRILSYVDKRTGVIVNVGSGPFMLEKEFTNVDIFPYKNVDVVADAMRLPFRDESVDAIMDIVMLEHTSEPERIIEEMYRVLKKGGYIYTTVPFIFAYHASPEDYKRWTISGVRRLHNRFDEVDCGVEAGPTSALVCILTDWLAILFSFRIQMLYKILYLGFMLTLWPLKFLDVFLIDHPMAKNAAGGFYYLGKKA